MFFIRKSWLDGSDVLESLVGKGFVVFGCSKEKCCDWLVMFIIDVK